MILLSQDKCSGGCSRFAPFKKPFVKSVFRVNLVLFSILNTDPCQENLSG